MLPAVPGYGQVAGPRTLQPAAAGPVMISSYMAEIELTYGKSKLAVLVSTHCRRKELGILTPASPDSLPPLGELIADEPFGTIRSAPRTGKVLRTCGCG